MSFPFARGIPGIMINGTPIGTATMQRLADEAISAVNGGRFQELEALFGHHRFHNFEYGLLLENLITGVSITRPECADAGKVMDCLKYFDSEDSMVWDRSVSVFQSTWGSSTWSAERRARYFVDDLGGHFAEEMRKGGFSAGQVCLVVRFLSTVTAIGGNTWPRHPGMSPTVLMAYQAYDFMRQKGAANSEIIAMANKIQRELYAAT
jgi:hypothetical protein